MSMDSRFRNVESDTMVVSRPSSLIEIPCRAVRSTRPSSDWMASTTISIPEAVISMGAKTGPKPTSLAVRFWAKVQIGLPDACWECVSSIRNMQRGGYGSIHVGGRAGKRERAHRVAYMLTYGPIPDGQLVLHSCDNPPCCNPAHLFLGDHSDNARDMAQKRRSWQQQKTECPRGHPYTPDNTRGKPNARRCRICVAEQSRFKRAQVPKPVKTECKHGHPWVEENIYRKFRPNGAVHQECRICHREREAERARRIRT